MAIEFNDREERAGSREERLSQDWIFDESWWGDGELTDGISAEAAGISAEALRAVNHDELRQTLKAFDDKIPAEEKLPAAPSSLPQPHRSLRVYLPIFWFPSSTRPVPMRQDRALAFPSCCTRRS
jgi:hypothetical protein